MSLASLLPQPKHAQAFVQVEKEVQKVDPRMQPVQGGVEPPPIGKRGNFTPRSKEDFGDGGAFPEIHVLQYPMDLGRKEKSATSVVPLTVGADGRIKYDMIVKQGHDKKKNHFSSFRDLIPKNFEDDELAKPDIENEMKIAEKTRAALGLLVDQKSAVARPTHVPKQKLNEPTFIRYTPSQQSTGHNSGAQQRIIRVQEMPVDPLEPPKFKHKRLPGGPPSPPVALMHSPPRKVTAEDQKNWQIPPCISNWTHIKGYTIPLDKRLAADGRGLQEVQINDKFAKLSESLFIAERTARSEIEERSNMLKKIQRKQKEFREDELRNLAARARKAGSAKNREIVAEDDYEEQQKETEEDIEDRDARDELRKDRKRDMRREMRMESRKDQAKGVSRAARDRERDVSEKIALGQTVAKSKDAMFDQRLFNQSEGIGAGFKESDSYDLYDKPLFKTNTSNYIYRDKGQGEGMSEGDLQEMISKSTSKFKPDRGFKGSERSAAAAGPRDKPVAFEKDEADPFGLGELMDSAKEGRKTLDGIGSQGHMSTAGGSGSSREELKTSGSVHESRKMNFEEGSSSRNRDRDRDRERDRESKRRRR
jgi:SNW domain-containing protein 1